MLPCITTGPIAFNLSCISHDLAIESIGTRPSSQFDFSEKNRAVSQIHCRQSPTVCHHTQDYSS
jgi:hypothetical protein